MQEVRGSNPLTSTLTSTDEELFPSLNPGRLGKNPWPSKRFRDSRRLTIGHLNRLPNRALQQMDFDTFYSASYDRVRRSMMLTFRDQSLAEEITQEAFVQSLKRWSNVSLLNHPDGWTMVVALNKGRDLHRRRVRRDAKRSLLASRPEANSGVSVFASIDSRKGSPTSLSRRRQASVDVNPCARSTRDSCLGYCSRRL